MLILIGRGPRVRDTGHGPNSPAASRGTAGDAELAVVDQFERNKSLRDLRSEPHPFQCLARTKMASGHDGEGTGGGRSAL